MRLRLSTPSCVLRVSTHNMTHKDTPNPIQARPRQDAPGRDIQAQSPKPSELRVRYSPLAWSPEPPPTRSVTCIQAQGSSPQARWCARLQPVAHLVPSSCPPSVGPPARATQMPQYRSVPCPGTLQHLLHPTHAPQARLPLASPLPSRGKAAAGSPDTSSRTSRASGAGRLGRPLRFDAYPCC